MTVLEIGKQNRGIVSFPLSAGACLMSAEKTEAIVIRQADFSESSRVVTLFTRDFGKISCLAKGAKRLKSAFEVSLDLLAECRVLFLQKSAGTLDLLTESQLIRRFQPKSGSLSHLYGGYYVAELVNSLTEEHDPHPELYSQIQAVLEELRDGDSIFDPICRFEISLLREIGQLPEFETCTICHSEIRSDDSSRFWVSQSGLICSSCGSPEYETAEFQPGTLSILRQLVEEEGNRVDAKQINPRQKKEIRRLLTAAVSFVLGRRPKTLPLLQF